MHYLTKSDLSRRYAKLFKCLQGDCPNQCHLTELENQVCLIDSKTREDIKKIEKQQLWAKFCLYFIVGMILVCGIFPILNGVSAR